MSLSPRRSVYSLTIHLDDVANLPLYFYSITVRWSFLCSLFCFLGMVASRLLIEFDLLQKGSNDSETKNKQDIGLLVLCALGALATHLLSYVNQNLWCWNSLIGMTIYLGKVCSSQLYVTKYV